MVIYEVNVWLDIEIKDNFAEWLESHISEMLNIQGFESAYWYESEEYNIKEQILWVIQFQLNSRDDLQTYLDEFAQNMRQKGIQIFKDRFRTERRILQLKQKY